MDYNISTSHNLWFLFGWISPIKAIVVFFRNELLVGENSKFLPWWYLLALIVVVLLKLGISKTKTLIISVLMALVGIGLDYCQWNDILTPIMEIYFKVFLKKRNGFFLGILYVA